MFVHSNYLDQSLNCDIILTFRTQYHFSATIYLFGNKFYFSILQRQINAIKLKRVFNLNFSSYFYILIKKIPSPSRWWIPSSTFFSLKWNKILYVVNFDGRLKVALNCYLKPDKSLLNLLPCSLGRKQLTSSKNFDKPLYMKYFFPNLFLFFGRWTRNFFSRSSRLCLFPWRSVVLNKAQKKIKVHLNFVECLKPIIFKRLKIDMESGESAIKWAFTISRIVVVKFLEEGKNQKKEEPICMCSLGKRYIQPQRETKLSA